MLRNTLSLIGTFVDYKHGSQKQSHLFIYYFTLKKARDLMNDAYITHKAHCWLIVQRSWCF